MEGMNEILQMVHEFYSDAFGQLITITIAIMAFVGGVIPIAITMYQNKQFKLSKEEVKKQIEKEINTAKRQLLVTVKASVKSEINRIDKLSTALEEMIDKKFEEVEAGVFHIQGSYLLNKKDYVGALESFLDAAIGYREGQDEQNMQRVIESILESCFPMITKDNHNKERDLEDKTKTLIDGLDSCDENGRYTDTIQELRQKLKESKDRVNKVTQK